VRRLLVDESGTRIAVALPNHALTLFPRSILRVGVTQIRSQKGGEGGLVLDSKQYELIEYGTGGPSITDSSRRHGSCPPSLTITGIIILFFSSTLRFQDGPTVARRAVDRNLLPNHVATPAEPAGSSTLGMLQCRAVAKGLASAVRVHRPFNRFLDVMHFVY